jgi:hypothetical protein
LFIHKNRNQGERNDEEVTDMDQERNDQIHEPQAMLDMGVPQEMSPVQDVRDPANMAPPFLEITAPFPAGDIEEDMD